MIDLRVATLDDCERVCAGTTRPTCARAVAAACARWARPAVAEIYVDNDASRACFEACGFVAVVRTDDLITYHWRP